MYHSPSQRRHVYDVVTDEVVVFPLWVVHLCRLAYGCRPTCLTAREKLPSGEAPQTLIFAARGGFKACTTESHLTTAEPQQVVESVSVRCPP